MNVLIKSATIIDSKSAFHNKNQDILIENGLITQIADFLMHKIYKEVIFQIQIFHLQVLFK